jgi:hypothetical protein
VTMNNEEAQAYQTYLEEGARAASKVQAVMSGTAADYVIDLLNTEIDSLREQVREFGGTSPELQHMLELVEEAYAALRGDAVHTNTDHHEVYLATVGPDGKEHHYHHTYSKEPLLLGIETDGREWFPADMRNNYQYWSSMFGGHEFNFLTANETER